ncbi:MAG: hypothetical protein V4449_03575 [Patescibacteria group bacterium]
MYTLSSRLGIFLSIAVLAVSALFIAPLLASANNDNDNNDREKKSDHRSVGSTLEVRIDDNGQVMVRGAKVTSVSGSVINAQTAFGSTVLSWSIRTSADTKFAHREDGSTVLSRIAVGDYISFGGMLNTSTSGLTVDAKSVKDWSNSGTGVKPVAFAGTVQSIDTPNLKFTLATGGSEGVITVKLATNSVITNGDVALAFGAILANDKAKVAGTYDVSTKTFTATKITIVREDINGHKTFRERFESFKNRFHFNF